MQWPKILTKYDDTAVTTDEIAVRQDPPPTVVQCCCVTLAGVTLVQQHELPGRQTAAPGQEELQHGLRLPSPHPLQVRTEGGWKTKCTATTDTNARKRSPI